MAFACARPMRSSTAGATARTPPTAAAPRLAVAAPVTQQHLRQHQQARRGVFTTQATQDFIDDRSAAAADQAREEHAARAGEHADRALGDLGAALGEGVKSVGRNIGGAIEGAAQNVQDGAQAVKEDTENQRNNMYRDYRDDDRTTRAFDDDRSRVFGSDRRSYSTKREEDVPGRPIASTVNKAVNFVEGNAQEVDNRTRSAYDESGRPLDSHKDSAGFRRGESSSVEWERAKGDANELKEETKQQARSTWQATKDTVKDTIGYVGEKTADAFEYVADTVRPSGSGAQNAEDAGNRVKGAWNDTKQEAKEAWRDTKHDTRNVGDKMKDGVKDAADSVKDGANRTKDHVNRNY